MTARGADTLPSTAPPSTTRRVRLLALAATLLALAWAFAPTGRTPPLYDGLGFPDQPYRYVHAPAGYRHTPAPSTAAYDIKLHAGGSSTYDVASAELGPQVEVFVNQADLQVPTGATVARIRATPIATASQPAGAEIWGNVYRLSAVTDHGVGHIRAGGALDSIRLRAPTGPPPVATIEFLGAGGWQRLSTSKIGNDIYSAPLAGVGDYAVVAPPGQARVPGATSTATSAPSSSAGSGSGATSSAGASQAPIGADTKDASAPSATYARPLLVIIAVALLVLVAVIAAIRFARRRDETTG